MCHDSWPELVLALDLFHQMLADATDEFAGRGSTATNDTSGAMVYRTAIKQAAARYTARYFLALVC